MRVTIKYCSESEVYIYIYLTVEMSTSGRFRLKGTDVCSLIKISDDDPAISLHFVLALNPWIKSCSRLPPTSPSYCRTRSNRASVSKCHAAAIMLVCTVRSRKEAVSVFFMVIKAAVLDESVHSKNVDGCIKFALSFFHLFRWYLWSSFT
jgi:hypothetical protein